MFIILKGNEVITASLKDDTEPNTGETKQEFVGGWEIFGGLHPCYCKLQNGVFVENTDKVNADQVKKDKLSNDKDSAITKLKAMGLTDDEIEALTGV